jgi:predicted transposase YdaD
VPVVLLEVQMHPDRHFHRRLGAETFRLLQQHEEINHLHVLVLLARRRDLDPALALLTLPVQQAQELGPCSQRILTLRPDLIELILPILSERFQGLSSSQIMATLGISKDFWRHTRAFQDILAEGRQEGVELGRREGRAAGREEGREEGRQEGRRREAFALALRLLERRCGAISSDSRSRIEALSLEHLEALALDLLDFEDGDDFAAWLERHGE